MFLALRELQHHRFRSFLLGSIVCLIAFMVFMLTGLTRGLSFDNAALLLTTPATHFITTTDAGGVFNRSFIDSKTVKTLQDQKEGQVAPLAQSFISLNHQGKQLSAVMLGLDPESFMAPRASEGTALAADSEGAVIDQSFQKEGVKVGDTLTLKPGGETLKVLGFTGQARLNHQPVVFVTLKVWNTFNPRARGTLSAVALKDPAETLKLPEGVKMLTRAETLQELPGYKEELGSLTMIQVFLVVVAAFVMAVFFYVLTLQKTSQFGLLKAIGATTRTLATSLIAQMLMLTTVAVVLAALVTLGMVSLLPEGMPFQLTLSTVLSASGLLVLVALLSSLLSLRSIARVDPLIAIGTAS